MYRYTQAKNHEDFIPAILLFSNSEKILVKSKDVKKDCHVSFFKVQTMKKFSPNQKLSKTSVTYLVSFNNEKILAKWKDVKNECQFLQTVKKITKIWSKNHKKKRNQDHGRREQPPTRPESHCPGPKTMNQDEGQRGQ